MESSGGGGGACGYLEEVGDGLDGGGLVDAHLVGADDEVLLVGEPVLEEAPHPQPLRQAPALPRPLRGRRHRRRDLRRRRRGRDDAPREAHRGGRPGQAAAAERGRAALRRDVAAQHRGGAVVRDSATDGWGLYGGGAGGRWRREAARAIGTRRKTRW